MSLKRTIKVGGSLDKIISVHMHPDTVVHNLKSLSLRKNVEHPIFMDNGTTAGLNGTTAGRYGTTAGLGYLEVLKLSMQILLLGQLDSVLTVSSQWGRRIQFLY